jgi:seryl-tRNA synthetase
MLDIKKIRENPEKVREALLKRLDNLSFDELLQWDSQRRQIIQEVESLRNERKATSTKIPQLKKSGQDVSTLIVRMSEVASRISELDAELRDLENKIEDFMSRLPNIPDADVPAGGKENNIVLDIYGEKPIFDFIPKNHVELCQSLDLIDYDRATKLSGAGHWIYKGFGAKLEWALLNYFIREHLSDGYEFLLVPHILNYQCGYVAGQFPKFIEDDFWIDGGPSKNGKFLLPTAETALVNYHRDEILDESDLPKKYFSYTPCFRREAGSTRIEERGMVRGHQFNKVELVHYAHPEHSGESFSELVVKAQKLVQNLGLHYQLTKLAAEDCSSAMARTHDIEIWIPSMGIYKEVSSASNGYDYQSRRGNIKYRDNNGKLNFVHMLNASGLATSRVIPAILEQCQKVDGSVVIPEVLRNDVGAEVIKPK